MNYYFNEVITKESINDLVEKITNTEGKINLWFSTEGGDVTYSNSRKPCSLDPLGQGWIEKK